MEIIPLWVKTINEKQINEQRFGEEEEEERKNTNTPINQEKLV